MSFENTRQSSSTGYASVIKNTLAAFSSSFAAHPQQSTETTNKSIFEMFGITDVFLPDCNIIGLDIGTSEWSAALARISNDGQCKIIDLCAPDNDGDWKDISVLFHSSSSDSWSMGRAAVTMALDIPGALFENFMVSPESEVIEECYGFNLDNPTHRALMQRLFQGIFKQVMSRIPSPDIVTNGSTPPKKMLVLVSLRSQPKLGQAALRYQNLLTNALKIAGFQSGDIHVAVVPEVQAAIAYLLYHTSQVELARCTVVIDVGATSVDAVVVKKGLIAGVYSRNLGASSIEENLLEMALCDASAESTEPSGKPKYFPGDEMTHQILRNRNEIYSRLETTPYFGVEAPPCFQFSQFERYCSSFGLSSSLIRLQLRHMKERFFMAANSESPSGVNADVLELNGGIRIVVDDASIRKALYQMPIFVPTDNAERREAPFRRAMIYRSYYEALSHFMAGLRSQYLMMESFPQVILTGGASVMPLVSVLVKKYFRTEPICSSQPERTISRGLAFIGYQEVSKMNILLEIECALWDTELSKKDILASFIKSNIAKSLVQKELDEIFKWVEGGSGALSQAFLSRSFQLDSGSYDEQRQTEIWWDFYIKDFIKEKVRIQLRGENMRLSSAFRFRIPNDLITRLPQAHKNLLIEFEPHIIFGKKMARRLANGALLITKDERMKFYLRAKDRKTQIINFLESHTSLIDYITDYTNQLILLLKKEFMSCISAYVESLTPYSI